MTYVRGLEYMKGSGVYGILHEIYGWVYVGSSGRSVRNRVSWHRAMLHSGLHPDLELQNLYDHSDEEQFKYIQLTFCAPEEARELELEYHKILGAGNKPPRGYNHSAETKLKQSASAKARGTYP